MDANKISCAPSPSSCRRKPTVGYVMEVGEDRQMELDIFTEDILQGLLDT